MPSPLSHFSVAVWFVFLGVYLYNALLDYKPPPNAVQEGGIVSLFLMLLLFAVAALCCAVSLANLLFYLLKRLSQVN